MLLLVLLLSVALGALLMVYTYSSYMGSNTSTGTPTSAASSTVPQASPIVPIQRAQQVKGTVELQQQQTAPELR